MLFNLLNLPFLGHIRSIVEFFRCAAVLEYFNSTSDPYRLTPDPAAAPFFPVPPSVVPAEAYSFLLDGRNLINGTVNLSWQFINNYYVGLSEEIKYFEIRVSTATYDSFTGMVTTESETINSATNGQTASKVLYDGEGIYSITVPFINKNVISSATTYWKYNYFSVHAYSLNGECLLLNSNVARVSMVNIGGIEFVDDLIIDPSKVPEFPPPPAPILQVPPECVNYQENLTYENPIPTNVSILYIETPITSGGVIVKYKREVQVTYNIAQAAFPFGSESSIVEYSPTSPQGPWLPLDTLVVGLNSNNEYTLKVLANAYTLIGSGGQLGLGEVLLRAVGNGVFLPDNFQTVGASGGAATIYFRAITRYPTGDRFAITCLGQLSLQLPGESCSSLTPYAPPVPDLVILTRSLVAGTFDDPCGIYQLLEFAPPDHFNIQGFIHQTKSAATVGRDYDGSRYFAHYGSMSSPACGTIANQNWINYLVTNPEAAATFVERAMIGPVYYPPVAGDVPGVFYETPNYAGAIVFDGTYGGVVATIRSSNFYNPLRTITTYLRNSTAFAYRAVDGTYVPKTPGSISMLTKVGDFTFPEYTILGQAGIVLTVPIQAMARGFGSSQLGTVYNRTFCTTRFMATHSVAFNTPEEVNSFYRANNPGAPTCPKATITYPYYINFITEIQNRINQGILTFPYLAFYPTLYLTEGLQAWMLPPQKYVPVGTLGDTRFLIIKDGGILRKDAVLALDDNSSAAPINWIYLRTDDDFFHLLTYEQKSTKEIDSQDWVNQNQTASCITSSGFLISNFSYYIASGQEQLSLVVDGQTLIRDGAETLTIENVLRVDFSSQGTKFKDSTYAINLQTSYIGYQGTTYDYITGSDGFKQLAPTSLDATYLDDVSEIGGAFYHITKKVGDPNTSLPHFCFGDAVDGFQSFLGVPRSTFENGYLEEAPDAATIKNYLEIIGAGTGFATVSGADIFNTGYAKCEQDFCFDPTVSKRGMIKIETNVSAVLAKRFKGIMTASVDEVSDSGNHIHVTDFYFKRTGASLNPEADVTQYYARETGILTPTGYELAYEQHLPLAMICPNCNNAKLDGVASLGLLSEINYSPIHEENGFTFIPFTSGTLRFSGTYEVYGPSLDCMPNGAAATYLYTAEHVEYVNYSLLGEHVPFFCITGNNCSIPEMNASVVYNVFFSGFTGEFESKLLEVNVINTGGDALSANARRFAKKGDQYFNSVTGEESYWNYNGLFDVPYADDPFTLPSPQRLSISGGETGIINRDVFAYGFGTPPFRHVYVGSELDPGYPKLGKDYIQSVVTVAKNAQKTDAVGRYVEVVSDFPGNISEYWIGELKTKHNEYYRNVSLGVPSYDETLDYISELDDVVFTPFDPLTKCDRLILNVIPEKETVDYRPVKVHVKNNSDLEIFTRINAYITKLERGVVLAAGGTGSSEFGNSGSYTFYDSQDSIAPYNIYQPYGARHSVVSGHSIGSEFFLDPNAHFITVEINRIFAGQVIQQNDAIAHEDWIPRELFVISKNQLPVDIFNYVKSGHPLSRVREVFGFHAKDSRQDIELEYIETKVLVQSTSLNLNDDTPVPHAGAHDSSFSAGGGVGFGATSGAAIADADGGYGYYVGQPKCIKIKSQLMAGDLALHVYVSSVVEQGGLFTASTSWVYSGFLTGLRNVNENPSMNQSVTFGAHTGYQFIAELVGGILSYGFDASGVKESGFNELFNAPYIASGPGLLSQYNGVGGNSASVIVGETTLGGGSHPYGAEEVFSPVVRSQIASTSSGPMLQFQGDIFGESWNLYRSFGTGTPQQYSEAFTGAQNNPLFLIFPGQTHDYHGLYRSFNKMEFCLKHDQNIFSGATIFLSGISIPTGNPRPDILGAETIWNNIGQTSPDVSNYGCEAFNGLAYTGLGIYATYNHRGKDFYEVDAYVVNKISGNSASGAFEIMKAEAEATLSGHFNLKDLNLLHGYIYYAFEGISGSSHHGNLVYTKEKLVKVESNPTFNLYRIDKTLKINVLETTLGVSGITLPATGVIGGNGFIRINLRRPGANLLIPDPYAGIGEIEGSCPTGFLAPFIFRFVNYEGNKGYIPTNVSMQAIDGDDQPAGSPATYTFQQLNSTEVVGGGILSTDCLSKYEVTSCFTNPTGSPFCFSFDVPVARVGSRNVEEGSQGVYQAGVTSNFNPLETNPRTTFKLYPSSGSVEMVGY